jgi:O-antigen/teichoic acid export membrane protein
LTRLAIVLVVPLVCGLVLGLSYAINLLYGAAFQPALPLAVLMTIVAALTFPVSLLGDQYLIATGRTVESLVITVCSASIALALVAILLPAFSTMALPLAALASESFVLAAVLAWLTRKGEISLRKLAPSISYLAVAIIGTVALFLLLPSSSTVFVGLALFACLCALSVFAFMTPAERGMVLESLRKAMRASHDQGA